MGLLPVINDPWGTSFECAEEDSNLHGMLLPPAPQAGASANSATSARWMSILAGQGCSRYHRITEDERRAITRE